MLILLGLIFSCVSVCLFYLYVTKLWWSLVLIFLGSSILYIILFLLSAYLITLLFPIERKKKNNIIRRSKPYKIYNIGNNQPVQLEKFISVLEDKIGKKAVRNYMEMQPGDVVRTYADTSDLEKAIDFKPSTSIEEGLERFATWYKEFYNIE